MKAIFAAMCAINLRHLMCKAAVSYYYVKFLPMRKIYLGLALLITLSSCVKVHLPQASKPAPAKAAPGQVKKTTGSQSAAPYAPGQQKKSASAAPVKKKN
jgi:hypothetical protein